MDPNRRARASGTLAAHSARSSAPVRAPTLLRPLLVLTVLTVLTVPVLAGCLGVTSDDDGGGRPPLGPVRLHAFGGFGDPGWTLVGAAARDVTGDGLADLFLADRGGVVTALDLTVANASEQKLWQVETCGLVHDLAFVGGSRGPAVAVASTSCFRFDGDGFSDTEVTLLNATANGTTLAKHRVQNLEVRRMVAADLDGDGADDLVLAGTPFLADPFQPGTPPEPPYDPYGQTAVVALDGRFDRTTLGDRLLGALGGDDDVLWRTTVRGDLRTLDVAGGAGPDGTAPSAVLVGTDRGLTALGPGDGGLRYQRTERRVVDVAVAADGGHVLAVHPDGATLLDADGTRLWSRDLPDRPRRGALGDLGRGTEAVVAWHRPDDRSGAAGSGADASAVPAAGVSSFGLDGAPRLNVTLNLTGLPAAVAVGPLTGHRTAEVAVAGPLDDPARSGLVVVAPDGTVVGAAASSRAPDDRDLLLLADALPVGGHEALVAGHEGFLSVFGAVPAG